MVIFILFMLLANVSYAKDLGIQGHLYEIQEPDLLKQIESRLKDLESSGDLEKHNYNLRRKAQHSVRYPKAVEGITNATKGREYSYDPSIVVPYDLKDHQGKIFHKKGSKVNPLKTIKLRLNLVFIDGEDSSQVHWFLQNHGFRSAKLILVKGSPFELMESYEHPVYFDQGGRLTSKFKIRHVPAVVTQKGELLQVNEVAL